MRKAVRGIRAGISASVQGLVLKKKRSLRVIGTKYIYLFEYHTWRPGT